MKMILAVSPGGTVTVDHLPFAAGELVEVTLTPCVISKTVDPADPTEGGTYPLRGQQPYRYDDPFGPAWDDNDWECDS
jgi:hypothetical protein